MKFEKNLTAITLFISSVLLFVLGTAIFIETDLFMAWFPYIAGVILLFTSLSKFYSFYTEKETRKRIVLIGDFLMLFQAILAFAAPDFVIIIFPFFVVFYAGILSIISFIAYHQYRMAHTPFAIRMFLKAVAFLLVAITIISVEYTTVLSVKMTGIYLIFYSISIFLDFINEEIPRGFTNRINRKVSVNMPVIFTANVMASALEKANEFFSSVDPETKQINLSEELPQKSEPDLHILIHVNRRGVGIFGHVDIVFDDHIISYGNYDEESIKLLGSLGEAVISFATGMDDYIKFCTESEGKTIFDYGLKLTEEQKLKVRERIEDHISNSVHWLSPYDRATGADREKGEFSDYASRLSRATTVIFRKMKQGKFKYYFSFYSNCVKFADSIVGVAGIDILNLNGIITPGAYYNYFDREYRRKNSIVLTKAVYTPQGTVK